MKERIIEATKRVIIKKGYQGLKVSDIAEEAKIGKGTVYLYFKDKEQILVALVDSFFAEADKFIEEAKGVKGNGVKKLKKFIASDLEFYEKNINFFSMLGEEVNSFARLLEKKCKILIIGKYLQIVDSIASLIRKCKEENVIGNIDPTEGTIVLMSIINGFAAQRIYGLSNQPLPKQSEKILKMFLKGVGK